jgi:hypothetical protein
MATSLTASTLPRSSKRSRLWRTATRPRCCAAMRARPGARGATDRWLAPGSSRSSASAYRNSATAAAAVIRSDTAGSGYPPTWWKSVETLKCPVSLVPVSTYPLFPGGWLRARERLAKPRIIPPSPLHAAFHVSTLAAPFPVVSVGRAYMPRSVLITSPFLAMPSSKLKTDLTDLPTIVPISLSGLGSM